MTVAMERKHDAAAELLVQPTIDAGMDIDAQVKEGKTVLMASLCRRPNEHSREAGVARRQPRAQRHEPADALARVGGQGL